MSAKPQFKMSNWQQSLFFAVATITASYALGTSDKLNSFSIPDNISSLKTLKNINEYVSAVEAGNT
jgi:hypothetical protein